MITLSQCPGIDPVKDSSAALQAALDLKQPITWDCPVNTIMGTDASKSIFAPNGTDITFTPKGRLDTDCAGFPALVFMHVTAILRGLRVRYTGTPGIALPTSSSAWTDGPAKSYLIRHGFNSVFKGVGGTFWTGPSNTSALVSIRGLSNVTMPVAAFTVDPGVGAPNFIRTAVGIDLAFAPGVDCTPTAPLVAPIVTASDITLDGVIMGFVGGGSKVRLSRMTRRRYADLQDAAGVIAQWFSPPHWFYLQGSPANPLTLRLTDCMDLAEFAGTAVLAPRYLHPLKVELANGSSIDGFYSRCPYGGFAVLSNGSTVGGTAKNLTFIVNTDIRGNAGALAGAPGLFFPSSHPYPASTITATLKNAAAAIPFQHVPAAVTTHLEVETNYRG